MVKPKKLSHCPDRRFSYRDCKSTKGRERKNKPFAFVTFSEQTARLRLDLATNLLNSARATCSGVRPDESSATEVVTVTRGGEFAAETKPRDPPATETAGKEEEEGEALRRLAG